MTLDNIFTPTSPRRVTVALGGHRVASGGSDPLETFSHQGRDHSGLMRTIKDIEMGKRRLPKVALSWLIVVLAMSLVIVALPMAKPVEAG